MVNTRDFNEEINPAMQEQKQAESGEALSDEQRVGAVWPQAHLQNGVDNEGNAGRWLMSGPLEGREEIWLARAVPPTSDENMWGLAAALAFDVPSGVASPTVFLDGDQWCALAGENLQVGTSAFGDTPAEAVAEYVIASRLPSPPVSVTADMVDTILGPALDERTERERFKAWATANFYRLTLSDMSGDYVDQHTLAAWLAWLARAAQQPLAGLASLTEMDLPDRPAADEYDVAYRQRAEAYMDALEAKLRTAMSASPPQVADVMESFHHSVTPPLVSEAGLPERPKASDGFSGDAIACDADQVDAYADAMEAQLRNALSERDAAQSLNRQYDDQLLRANAGWSAALDCVDAVTARAEKAESERDQARADADELTVQLVDAVSAAKKAEAALAERGEGYSEWWRGNGPDRLAITAAGGDYEMVHYLCDTTARAAYLAGAKAQPGNAQGLVDALEKFHSLWDWEFAHNMHVSRAYKSVRAALAAHRQQEAQ